MKEAINYLEQLEVGNFLTVNIPISGDNQLPITAMYIGKDKAGRYNFIDNSKFILSKEFIERGKISIDKEYDGDKALDIHALVRKQNDKNKIKKDRESR